MELKEGMYVRSKINGMIAKITDTEILCVRNPAIEAPYTKDIRYILDNNLNRGFCESEKDSVKASYNIFDLIEEHDILLLLDKEYGENYKAEVVLDGNDFKVIVNYEQSNLLNLEYELITEEHIKLLQIVTKEQFESISYKVGE